MEPLILTGCQRGRGAFDEYWFHLPTIRQFAHQWPRLDFSDYPSATTPGYHVLLAAADRLVGDRPRTLKWIASLFSIGLLSTLAAATARRAGFGPAVAVCLPVACSLYVVSSAAWLLPDNAGWWGVLGIMLLALRGDVDGWTYFLGGLIFLAVVLVRQNHAWILAPLCAAVWMKPNDSRRRRDAGGPSRVAFLLLVCLPAMAALGWFIRLWHGMTPPSQRGYVGGFNPAAPVMALAVGGAIGVFFLPIIASQLPARHAWRLAVPGAIVGLLIGIVPATSYSVADGRYSGIWNAVPHFPVVLGRSSLVVGLAALGGVVMSLWLAILPSRRRWIWFSAAVAFGAAQAAGHNAFQRYDEPFILIAAALSLAPAARHSPRWTWFGPLALSGILAAITLLSLRL
ncbi:MAG TPA: hypothetical protein VG326_04075 [Tepidisphaeraceae bacterium]|nr:hypothetical protein [Tepidisphaeraceae bacterium]